MLQALLGPVAGLAKTWMNNRHEQSQAKHQAKMEVISNTATWEEKMAEASNNRGKTSFGRLYSQSHYSALDTLLWLMMPLLLIAFVIALTFYLLCLIGISIFFFSQSAPALESGVLIS